MDDYCTTDPTIVACTQEDQGRELGDGYVPPAVPTVTQPAPVPVAEVGTVAVPSSAALPAELGHTGPVPAAPYLVAALLLVVAGRALLLWARRARV